MEGEQQQQQQQQQQQLVVVEESDEAPGEEQEAVVEAAVESSYDQTVPSDSPLESTEPDSSILEDSSEVPASFQSHCQVSLVAFTAGVSCWVSKCLFVPISEKKKNTIEVAELSSVLFRQFVDRLLHHSEDDTAFVFVSGC